MRLRQGTELRLEISGEVRPQLMKRETGFGSQHFFLDCSGDASLPERHESTGRIFIAIPSGKNRVAVAVWSDAFEAVEEGVQFGGVSPSSIILRHPTVAGLLRQLQQDAAS